MTAIEIIEEIRTFFIKLESIRVNGIHWENSNSLNKKVIEVSIKNGKYVSIQTE